MNKKQLKALAKETAQGLNSEEDIAALTKLLRQSFYEKALDTKLDDHLGYERNESRTSNNRRNGYTKRTVQSDDAAKKVVYLAIQEASKKWSMPIRNWKSALNRLIIEFEERLTSYL